MNNSKLKHQLITPSSDSSSHPDLPAFDYKELFLSVPDPCLVLDPNLRIVAVNAAYLHATMTKRDEIIGHGIFHVFPDNPAEPGATGVRNLKASLAKVLQSKSPDTMAVQKYDIRKPEEEGGGFEERFWSPINSPVLNSQNEIAYIIHRVQDVTEFIHLKQKVMEENRPAEELRERMVKMDAEIYNKSQQVAEANLKLKQSENKFSKVFHSVPALILLSTAKEGRIIDVNETALKTLGYEREEVIGRTTEEIGMWEDISDRSTVLRTLEEQGPVTNIDIRWKGKNGQVLIGLYSGEFIELDGERCILGAVRDISERKKAEEALVHANQEWELTFNSVPDLISIFDDQNRILRVNKAMADRLGRQPEECTGRPCYEIIHQMGKPPGFCPHLKTLADSQVHHAEICEASLGGDFLVSTSPLVDDNGKMRGAVHVARDISEQKQAVREIERLNTDLAARAIELEVANREMEAFNYTVAHDLRNPLNLISGYSQIIKEFCGDRLDEKCNEYLQQTYAATLRMNQLITALLEFSQMGRVEIQREIVDVSAIALTVAEELQQSEPGRRLTLRISEGIYAEGDPGLLRVVMDNLIGNAWKYTATRDEAIVELGTAEIDGSLVCFVRDNGSGFDMTEADKLFAPFQRLSGVETQKGFGIGLATVERIIQRHGGRIWAEGEPDMGATFYFILPGLSQS